MATRKKTSKRHKNTVSSKESSLEADNCIICFEKVSCRGKLSVCDHWFCFECIYEWSKNTNSCPVCKKRFRCISKTHLTAGKSPLQKVRVGDVDQRVWNDDDDDQISVVESLSPLERSSVSFDITDAQVDFRFYSEYLGHDNSFVVSDSDSENECTDSDTTCTSVNSSEDNVFSDSSSSESSSSDDWNLRGSPDNSTPVHKQKTNYQLRVTINDDSDDDMDGEQPCVRQTSRANNFTGFHRRTKTQKASGRQFQEAAKRAESATASRKKDKREKVPTHAAASSSSTRRTDTQNETTSSNITVGQWLNVNRERLPSSRRTEKPKPEKPKPRTEKSKPRTEKPKPKIEKPKPRTEKPKPRTEKPKPRTEKQKPRTARNEKPVAQSRSSTRTRGPGRNSNDAMATNSCTQSNHPSSSQARRRHKTPAVAFDSDSEISNEQPIASKTRSSKRKALSLSPELTKERTRRRYVLRERQNNEFD